METLKEMRLRCGYSRPQVANKLNVSDTAIAHWEAEDWTPSTKYHTDTCAYLRCAARCFPGNNRGNEEAETGSGRMKHKEEAAIILSALAAACVPESNQVKSAVDYGLKLICIAIADYFSVSVDSLLQKPGKTR